MSILAWTTAFGVNRKSDVSAGTLALSVGVIWWTVIVTIVNVIGPEQVLHRLPLISVMAMGPGGPLTLLSVGRLPSVQLGCAMAAAAVVHVSLFAWYVRRFGRSESIGAFSPQTVHKQTSQLEWLGMPRRSPLSAIIWKQSRESGPIVLAGLAAILAIPAFFALAGTVSEDHFSSYDLALFMLVLTGYIGFLVVLIVGIGVFDHDLSTKLHSFWRSRPIDPNLWYWTKYLTGLSVLAVALTLPVVVAGLLLLVGHPRALLQIQFLPFVIAISVYWAVYTLASTTICLVRVAIYAAILSVGVLTAGVGVLWYLVDASNTQWTPADWIRTVTISAFITAVLATLIGWWAVRRDIGWKK